MTSPAAATILIVDDEAPNRKLLEALLRPEGYVTLSCATGQQALDLVAQKAPDLILLDVMLPDMDGYEVANRLKADPATASIPIIMVTARLDRDARLAGLKAGAEEFLTKPVERAELWLRVRNLLRLKALTDELQSHSASLEQQVQARTQSLRESERRFSDLLGNVEMASMMLDSSARITYCNDYLLRLTGWDRDEIIGQDWFATFLPAETGARMRTTFSALAAGLPEGRHCENEILTRSGGRRLIRWNNSLLRSGTGDTIGTASIGEDVTERNEAADRIAYLNRVHAVLSGINSLIVRVHDRDELFSEACRIALDKGGFRMACIVMADPLGEKLLPVASAGVDAELLSSLRRRYASDERLPLGSTMAARAMREKRAIVSRDLESNPGILFGRKHAEGGVLSIAVLPLIVAAQAVGALALFAGENEFFHEEELKLLTELAGDIAFALDHIEKEKRLHHLAYYDALSGLANRSLFLERSAQSMRAAAAAGHKLALALVDLARFKDINDTLGRSAGDELLRQVAALLARDLGEVNLARIGPDQFAIMLPKIVHAEDAARVLEKTLEGFHDHPFHLDDGIYRVAAKAGVTLFPDDGVTADTLLNNAESALKKAKAGNQRYLFYTQRMTETVAGRLSLENQLRQALDRGEFVLHYQPKVSLASGALTGVEALIRWNDPRTGLVPPARFIPVLEETGLIHDVGHWALRQAIEDYLRWRKAGLQAVRVAVNVSPLQLRNRGFASEIGHVIALAPGAHAGLELEITESVIMEEVKHSIATLQAIRGMGVKIAIDDFGTGFSSLSYLSKLPVDTLKIDRSFVTDMTVAPEGLALVSTIISLAHSMKLTVVAEGVETEEQSRLLRLLDCDEMQGYFFSRPVPVEAFEARFLSLSPADGVLEGDAPGKLLAHP